MKLKIQKKMKLYPKSGKLQIKDGKAFAIIVDAESDPFRCDFDNDDCVRINTNSEKYITLDFDAISTLERLIIEAKKFYRKSK